jgi:hypothetical protein
MTHNKLYHGAGYRFVLGRVMAYPDCFSIKVASVRARKCSITPSTNYDCLILNS